MLRITTDDNMLMHETNSKPQLDRRQPFGHSELPRTTKYKALTVRRGGTNWLNAERQRPTESGTDTSAPVADARTTARCYGNIPTLQQQSSFVATPLIIITLGPWKTKTVNTACWPHIRHEIIVIDKQLGRRY